MVRRPSPKTAKLLEGYIPVRVTDMRGVDLRRWTFDFDLTLAAVIAAPDGEVLHRYGSRDERGADQWLSADSFQRFLQAGQSATVSGGAAPAPVPLRLEEVPAFAERDKGACIHCHSVRPAFRIEAQRAGTWSRSDLWVYPPPGKLGIDLDRDDQQLVTAVVPGSVAEASGLKVGDRIVRFDGSPVATATDLMAALGGVAPDGLGQGGKPPRCVVQSRGQEPREITLPLAAGWKTYTPAQFAWRPSKWGLAPAPGFGGPVLAANELRELGLEADTFAFRVTYLVTWGENQRFGKAAAKAGLREGMVVLGTAAKRDFLSIDHFHAWWRLTVPLDSKVEIVVHGAREPITIPVGSR